MSEEPITVTIAEARPNTLFSEELRQAIRFLRFSVPVACAECGSTRKAHWTMLGPFFAHTFPKHAFVLQESGTRHEGMTPVCRAHLLALARLPEEAPP